MKKLFIFSLILIKYSLIYPIEINSDTLTNIRKSDPKSLEEASHYLDLVLTQKAKEKFKSLDEIQLKNIEGLFLVEEWVYSDSSKFRKLFSKYEYLSYDEIMFLTLLSYHRYINYKNFDLTTESNKLMIQKDSLLNYQNELKKQRETLDSLDGVYIPKDIDDCMLTLDKILTDKQRNNIYKSKGVVERYIKSYGYPLIKIWKLREGSRFSKYLEEKEIQSIDYEDIAGFILFCYYKYLHHHKIIYQIEKFYYQLKDIATLPNVEVPLPVPVPEEYYEYLRTNKINDFKILNDKK